MRVLSINLGPIFSLWAPGEALIAKKDSFCLGALKLGGLTPREHSAKLLWEALNPEEQNVLPGQNNCI